jgi:hypothetical protein
LIGLPVGLAVGLVGLEAGVVPVGVGTLLMLALPLPRLAAIGPVELMVALLASWGMLG